MWRGAGRMSVVVLVLGILLAAAGVALIGFGIPINELSRGTTLILAGTSALVGGLVMVGLAAVVVELARVAALLRARQAARPAPSTTEVAPATEVVARELPVARRTAACGGAQPDPRSIGLRDRTLALDHPPDGQGRSRDRGSPIVAERPAGSPGGAATSSNLRCAPPAHRPSRPASHGSISCSARGKHARRRRNLNPSMRSGPSARRARRNQIPGWRWHVPRLPQRRS